MKQERNNKVIYLYTFICIQLLIVTVGLCSFSDGTTAHDIVVCISFFALIWFMSLTALAIWDEDDRQLMIGNHDPKHRIKYLEREKMMNLFDESYQEWVDEELKPLYKEMNKRKNFS